MRPARATRAQSKCSACSSRASGAGRTACGSRSLFVPLLRFAWVLLDRDQPQETAAIWKEIVQGLVRVRQHAPAKDARVAEVLEQARRQVAAHHRFLGQREKLESLAASEGRSPQAVRTKGGPGRARVS